MKLKELLEDYQSGLISEQVLSHKLLAMDKREITNGTNSDTRVRGVLKDYLRCPRDPLDIVVEHESQERLLKVINEITKELLEGSSRERELFQLFILGIIYGKSDEHMCDFLGVSQSVLCRRYGRLSRYLQKYAAELSDLLEEPESTLEAKAPRDFIRYPSEFYRNYYEGQVNRQGNYLTHCRIERYLDGSFGDDKTCCGMCDKCTNVTMRKRSEY